MKNVTDVTMLLDRSGSMMEIASDVVGGINSFLESQREAKGYATFTLVQFDSMDPQEIVIDNQLVTEVKDLKDSDFLPRASTPLFDALGQAITRTGERLKALAEDERPDKVVFVVVTDGEENASHEYTLEMVKAKIELQKTDYAWEFVFIGADIDAFANAGALGISTSNTLNSAKGMMGQSICNSGAKLSAYRSSGNVSALAYTDTERKEVE